jgi:hypothetical protein
MLCSKKMILPSKFNVKLRFPGFPGFPKFSKGGGGVRDLGQGGGVIFSQGGGGYHHPTTTLWPCMKGMTFSTMQCVISHRRMSIRVPQSEFSKRVLEASSQSECWKQVLKIEFSKRVHELSKRDVKVSFQCK